MAFVVFKIGEGLVRAFKKAKNSQQKRPCDLISGSLFYEIRPRNRDSLIRRCELNFAGHLPPASVPMHRRVTDITEFCPNNLQKCRCGVPQHRSGLTTSPYVPS